MKLTLACLFTSGDKKTVICNAADMIAFEEHFDKSVSALSKDPRLTYMVFLAWHAEKRTKATDLEFEAWAETIEDIGETDDPKD